MKNAMLDTIVDYMQTQGYPYYIITHRQPTVTIAQKQGLIERFPDDYAGLLPVVIVQGSLLCYNNGDSQHILAYFHDGAKRINFRELKRQLKIPKKHDLVFCRGNLQQIVGSPEIEAGAVSVINTLIPSIEASCFDRSLIEDAALKPSQLYDIAITLSSSLFANISCVYEALMHADIGEKIRLV